jgi:hypothetical protein
MKMSACWLSCLFVVSFALATQADEVVMQNRDRYNGKIVSVTTNTLVFQSEILGTITLPRGKVVAITFGSASSTLAPAATAVPAPIPSAKAGESADTAAQLRQLRANSNLISQVQSQILGGAGPEANAKFSQMMDDLSTGKMNMAGLRAEAKSAADQLRSIKKQGGDETGTLDMYLSVLENFLQETTPGSSSAKPAASP